MNILHSKFISFIIFLIAVIYFFSGIFFGLDFTDSFFHINQALIPANGTYLYHIILSSIVIAGIVDVFGSDLIILRLLNSFLLFAAIVIPFFFVARQPSFSIKTVTILSLVLVLLAPMNLNILGYDTLSVFFLSIIFSIVIIYIKKPNFYLIFIIAMLSAAAILLRLPNILIVPILASTIFFTEMRGRLLIGIKGVARSIGTVFYYISLTLLLVWLSYYTYYKEMSAFLEASLSSSSYSLKPLLYKYLSDGAKLLSFVLFILINFFFFNRSKGLFANNKLIIHHSVFAIAQISFILLFVSFTAYSWNYSLFLTALVVAFISVNVYRAYSKSDKHELTVLLLFTLFLFINPFGSNTGLLKASSLLVLLPFIFRFLNFNSKSFWLYSLILLVPFAIAEKVHNTYEDNVLYKLQASTELSGLRAIRTSDKRAKMINEIDGQAAELQNAGVRVFFYGNKSHIFHYLYPSTSLGIKSFSQPIDKLTYLPDIRNQTLSNEDIALFIIHTYPETCSQQGSSVLEIELLKLGFERKETDTFKYYLKSQNADSQKLHLYN